MLIEQDNGKHRANWRLVWAALIAGLLLCLAFALPAGAQKYSGWEPNPDTAPDRRDTQMGTSDAGGAPKIGQDPVTGDFHMETTPREPVQDQYSGNQTYEIDILYPGLVKPPRK